jgi:hypothetical protein
MFTVMIFLVSMKRSIKISKKHFLSKMKKKNYPVIKQIKTCQQQQSGAYQLNSPSASTCPKRWSVFKQEGCEQQKSEGKIETVMFT